MFKTHIKLADDQYLPEGVNLEDKTFNCIDDGISYIDQQLNLFIEWLINDISCKDNKPIYEIQIQSDPSKEYYCAIVDINHGDAKCSFEVKKTKTNDQTKEN